jgi:hypothetical protein
VFDNYMDFRRTNYTGGYDGLQEAGIATLASNDEIRQLVELVLAHGEAHPLGSSHATVFQNVDLLKLFRFAAEKPVNFLRRPIEEIIRDSGVKA